MARSIPCYLTVHGGFLPSSFYWGLISHFFWALLTPPRPALLSGRLRALRNVVTTHSPPLSPCLHFHTTEWQSWRCTLHTRCEGGPGELTSRPGQGWGWQSRPLSALPIPKDVHTCCALWLTSASHFPQQRVFPASLGRTSVGMVPVSLPFQSSWAWYDCFFGHSVKDASKERKPLMPQQFIKK